MKLKILISEILTLRKPNCRIFHPQGLILTKTLIFESALRSRLTVSFDHSLFIEKHSFSWQLSYSTTGISTTSGHISDAVSKERR